MNKKIVLLLVLISLFGLVSSTSAAVVIPNPLGGVNDFGQLLLKIAQAVGVLIGALGTIMIIVAGILFLTSAGSPEKIGAAKKALIYAIIGIVVAVIAGTIVSIVEEILGVK